MAENRNYPPITPDTYRVTLPAGLNFEFVSAYTIFPYRAASSAATQQQTDYYRQQVYEDEVLIFDNTYRIVNTGTIAGGVYTRGENIGSNVVLKNNSTYKVVYTYDTKFYFASKNFTNRVTYTFSVVENKFPLKKWTVTDVINRLLDVCEPLRKGETPRFRLNGMSALGEIIPEGQEGSGQAAKFDKIIAPQFALTRQTLRECLQEIGKFIHGEPRLRIKKGSVGYLYKEVIAARFDNGESYIGSDSPAPYEEGKTYYILVNNFYYNPATVELRDDGYYLALKDNTENYITVVYERVPGEVKYYYEVYYDLYASQEGTDLWFMPYTSKGAEWAINNYQTWVDSNAENLINQLDKLGGVIVEPYENGAKSVRTENQYVRIEEGNMLIATQYPIYTVDKLEYVYTADGETKTVDITAYVFEKSEYDTRLSSYQEQYPYSKAYALYFAQGSKNIGGLNFKVESASSLVFKNYAITNILKQILGSGYSLPAYPLLAFRITYTPIYGVRVAQTKSNYKDFKYPAALIYNQQSNVIESRYYGENLKGVAARLGNVEKSLMYCLKWLKIAPKAGRLFHNDYYISAVATEILPTYIRCTAGLSKDFNRISAYIGVPSEKRYYEISQQQAVDRNVLWREYIVIGKEEEGDEDSLIGFNMMRSIAKVFVSNSVGNTVTHVRAWGTSFRGKDLPAVDLPVVSSAFGNSISFSWRYENNYSAGAISQKNDGSITGNVTGYWQNDARYTDYYGRIYYYNFSLESSDGGYSQQESLDLPQSTIPTNSGSFISTIRKAPYILRKDNREALQINFQIDFVTNDDLIIGSALAASCSAVNRRVRMSKARLYVFPTELNKFTDHIEGWEDLKLDDLPYVELSNVQVFPNRTYFSLTASPFPASGKSWAIVTPQSQGEAELVEDEEGNQYEFRQTEGGDLLIGKNEEVTAGQAFTPIYFTKKREIFNKSVWVDIK